MTETEQWEETKVSYQTIAGVKRIPGTLVKAVMTTLEGGDTNVSVRTGLHRRLFRGQREIGWRNMLRGRVHKEWHKLQKREPGVDQISPAAWQHSLVVYVLELIRRRWKLRCTMVADADGEKERAHLLSEYQKMSESEAWRDLNRMDNYLTEDRHRPGEGTSLETLRELLRTCEIAVQARQMT